MIDFAREFPDLIKTSGTPEFWPIAMVRTGVVSEVARYAVPESLALTRDTQVVVETHRGPQLGVVLDLVQKNPEPDVDAPPSSGDLLRIASEEDLQNATAYKNQARQEFDPWQNRITQWQVELQLIDIEYTLDGEKLILYVLNSRGPETTKLALRAAAEGFGVIEVQPVGLEGIVPKETGGGCGSCGAG